MRKFDFEYGTVTVSQEATVGNHSVFQQNTIAAKVEFDTGYTAIVVFPVNWLANHSADSREDVLVAAMYGVGGLVGQEAPLGSRVAVLYAAEAH